MSDFPEFDQAYNTILIKDPNDNFERLAANANFNVYHSDIWCGCFSIRVSSTDTPDCMSLI